MSSSKTKTKEKEFVQVPLEDLNHFWLESGFPVFVATREDIKEQIFSHGINFFYLIGSEEKLKKSQPQVFKVTKSEVFTSMTAVPDDVFLTEFKEATSFSLPKIPFQLTNLIDQFFREVFKDKGTEATVILTYDTALKESMNPSDGWGILIPDQSNTAHNCQYEPLSIVDEIPNDTTLIVGTVHSHPMMSAYASATDHKDQSDNDGIHITYGWSEKTNYETDYHIELQIDGQSWSLEPNQVFEMSPKPDPDPVIKKWNTKVSKQKVPDPWTWDYKKKNDPPLGKGKHNPGKLATTYLPPTAPNEKDQILIGVAINNSIHEKASPKCPFCLCQMTDPEIFVNNRCYYCNGLVVVKKIDDVEFIMENFHKKSSIISAINGNSTSSVYLWYKDSGYKDVFEVLPGKKPGIINSKKG